MLALLGLLAVAGYQNRDKIQEVIGNVAQGNFGGAPGLSPAPATQPASAGGLGGLLGDLFGGANPGQTMHGGLTDLINHITGNGHGEAAQSWVQDGPNRGLGTNELESALGSQTIAELSQRTGLTKEDLLARLKSVLPTAVDQMTPQGRLPTQSEATGWLNQAATQTA